VAAAAAAAGVDVFSVVVVVVVRSHVRLHSAWESKDFIGDMVPSSSSWSNGDPYVPPLPHHHFLL
jgi:hypothetical protein